MLKKLIAHGPHAALLATITRSVPALPSLSNSLPPSNHGAASKMLSWLNSPRGRPQPRASDGRDGHLFQTSRRG